VFTNADLDLAADRARVVVSEAVVVVAVAAPNRQKLIRALHPTHPAKFPQSRVGRGVFSVLSSA
jgi:hypothetical protein